MTELAKLYSETIRKARKQHKCYECSSLIHKGDKYYDIKGLWEDRFSNFRIHRECQEFRLMFEREALNRDWTDCIAFGELIESIECYSESEFLNQWNDESNHIEYNHQVICEMKAKYEFDKL